MEVLAEIRRRFEDRLKAQIDALDCSAETKAVVQYVMFPGGKRIRPLLILAIGSDLGVDELSVTPPAIAIEMLHVASLIHDDLPAVDNDDMRRGRPSAHVAFTQGRALLAADFMIAEALAIASSASDSGEVPRNDFFELARAFSRVSDGQVLDLKGSIDRSTLELIHSKKTAAMFEAAFVIPGHHLGLSRLVVEQFRALGRQFGLLFQMVDDFLDVFGTDQERGRPGSSDIKNQKITFVTGRPALEAKGELQRAEAQMIGLISELEGRLGRGSFANTRSIIEAHRTRVAAVVDRALVS